MFCSKCGKNIGESCFCMYCGNQIKTTNVNNNESLRSDLNNNNVADNMYYEHNNGNDVSNVQDETAKPKKKKKLALFLVPGILGVLVIVGVLALYFTGIIGSAAHKLKIATANTYSDLPEMMKQFDLSDILNLLSEEEVTVRLSAEYNDIASNILYSKDSNNYQFKCETSGYALSPVENINMIVNLDSEKLSFASNFFGDEVFSYNYKEEPSGYIVNIFEENGISSDDVNEMIENIYSKEINKEFIKDYNAALDKFIDSFEIKKADSKEFVVAEKEVKCKGYEVEITKENILVLVDEVEKIYEKHYKEQLGVYAEEIGDVFDEIRENDDFLDVELVTTIYTYKNKIAAIVMENEGEEIEVLFKGKEKRTYDFELRVNDKCVLWLEGRKEGLEERYDLHLPMSDMIITYDTKSNKYSVLIMGYETVSFSGLIKGDEKFLFTIDSFNNSSITESYNGPYNVEIAISNKAEIEKLDGNKNDLSKMSESELRSKGEEMFAMFSNYDYDNYYESAPSEENEYVFYNYTGDSMIVLLEYTMPDPDGAIGEVMIFYDDEMSYTAKYYLDMDRSSSLGGAGYELLYYFFDEVGDIRYLGISSSEKGAIMVYNDSEYRNIDTYFEMIE